MGAKHHHNLISDLIDSELSLGDQIQFKVVSNSMAPILEVGDVVTASITPADKIQRGNIIVIRREADYLTHRAIKPDDGGWLTKGDNTVQFDAPVKTNRLTGVVTAVHKGDQSILFEGKKWTVFNPILASLGELESKAFALHPFLRYPFRFGIKAIQKFIF